ncbi:MAG: radical SAM protein [Desulfobacterales bacterium]|nr:radical SAM protein [Desulfobacterales bacterium]
MKIRLALVSSPVSLAERYGEFAHAANTEPSFGLACLGAVAQNAGADVTIIESSAQNLSVEESLKKILQFDPHIVGISSTTVGVIASGELARRIKKANPEIFCIIGGCHATALPEQTLNEFQEFDMVVIGEGEDTLREILMYLEKEDKIPGNLDGTAIRDGETVRRNKPRALITDLDELQLPAWSLLPGFPEAFRPSPARIRRWPCASVVLTRGCPNQCTFCDRSVFGKHCRAYSPSYALRMIKDLRYNYGVKEILIEDDTFVISKKRVREFCEQLISEKVDISWSCLGRADCVAPEILKLMKKAGCWHISYGIESGDPNILKAMKKNMNTVQMRQAVQWSKDAGLRVKGFFIVGFPNESELTLKASRELAKSLPLDDISVMRLTPFPGSELYNIAGHYGFFEQDWRKMNTINTVFVPDGFSKQDIEVAHSEMIREFYMRPSMIFNQLRYVASNPRFGLAVLCGLPDFFKIIRKTN